MFVNIDKSDLMEFNGIFRKMIKNCCQMLQSCEIIASLEYWPVTPQRGAKCASGTF